MDVPLSADPHALTPAPDPAANGWQHLTAPRPADWERAGQLADDWDFAQDILDPDERSWLRRDGERVFITLQFPVLALAY